MAASFAYPDDEEDSHDLESPPTEPQSFDWNQWAIDIDTKNMDALLDDDDGGPSSIEISLFRHDRGTQTRDLMRRAAK